MQTHTLSTLTVGQSATIQALHVDADFQHRLQALGFRLGHTLTLLRIAPFNGPLHLRLGNTEVMLRRSDAKHITVI